MLPRLSPRAQRLTELRNQLEKVYEADDVPPHVRRLIEQLDRKPPKQPVKPH